MDDRSPDGSPHRGWTRRHFLAAGAAGAAGVLFTVRSQLLRLAERYTELPEFTATPQLLPHDPVRDRRTIWVARGGSPAENIDDVLAKLGGMARLVGGDDVVAIKVAAQWWNQGMTNVAALRRVIEHVLAVPGFQGEVIVFENTHFRLAGGSGLARGFSHPSVRNVDVPGWNRMSDLVDYYRGRNDPVSVVGLVDAGGSDMDEAWRDPTRAHGTYGGDGRGPILAGEERDGYHWDFDHVFRVRRSRVSFAQTPLSWPVFSSPRSGLVVDLKDGVFRRQGGRRTPAGRALKWINMTVANEHYSTGLTACCKSAMGVVDMSAGRRGNHPLVRDYQSVHYFGAAHAAWRMAGPLAWFARHVRAPDLYLSVAQWVGSVPAHGWDGSQDHRLADESAVPARVIVAGTDPVAIDSWLARNVFMPLGGANTGLYDLDDPDSRLTKFLRCYRQVYQSGTLDPALIEVA